MSPNLKDTLNKISEHGTSRPCEDYVKCADGSQCIQAVLVFDGKKHCHDGSDEDIQYHPERDCLGNFTKCKDSLLCITNEDWCNNVSDCRDGSDEDPLICTEWNCTAGYWKCKDGLQCVSDSSVCNGDPWGPACRDGSDDEHSMCTNWTCPTDSWAGSRKCADGVQCIGDYSLCDGKEVNCNDGSDEDPAICYNITCPPRKWKCKDGLRCIYKAQVMNGDIDCQDGSDENLMYHDCPKKGWVKCNDSTQCIQNTGWCDGRAYSYEYEFDECYACRDGSDEGPQCRDYDCLPNYWKCADDLQCIPVENVCDGSVIPGDINCFNKKQNCRDKSDESNVLWNSGNHI